MDKHSTWPRFPSFELDQVKKEELYNNIKRQQHNQKEQVQRKPRRLNNVFHTLLIVALLIGFSSIIIYQNVNVGPDGNRVSGGGESHTLGIQLPEDIELKELERNKTYLFEQNGLTVGGIKQTTKEEMDQFLATSPIFEREEHVDTSLPYPTLMALEHVKQENISQTYHYFVMIEEEVVFDLYFHTPHFAKEDILPIVQTFEYLTQDR